MNSSGLAILCGVALLLCLVVPASCSVAPLWMVPGSKSGELSGVVISADGSTIIAGGDELISLTPEGRKRWAGWSATSLAVSSNGDYIIASKGPDVRLISGAGRPIWEKSLEMTVTDLSITPDASVIAAAGGGGIRILKVSGEDIGSNSTLAVKHIRIMPAGDRILVTTNTNVQLSDFALIPDWSDTDSAQNLIAVAPDGSSFVTAIANRIRMYNGTGKLIWDKRIGGGNAEALAYSRDGSVIVIGTDDNHLQVLNRYGTSLWTATAANWITCVAVSDDGSIIAAGSMDRKLYVYNRAGTLLGTFSAQSAIKFNSVAMTGDGSLIVVVDETAVYGFSRSSFMPEGTPEETITGPSPGTIGVTTTTPLPTTTTRKVTPRIPTVPTPYPAASQTTEAALPLAVPLTALLLLFLWRSGKA
jgi:WD40 repeat protein